MWPFNKKEVFQDILTSEPFNPPTYKTFTVLIEMIDGVQLIREFAFPSDSRQTEIADKVLYTYLFDDGNGKFYPKHSIVSITVKS